MDVLKVKNVVKTFNNKTAVDDVSFSVESGKIFGLLGPNGAGKTTMIRMITNIYLQDSGEIELFGEPVSSKLQNRIGYLPEERGLYKKLKVIEQLIYFGMLKSMSRKDAIQSANRWLGEMEALDWTNKKIQELSKGMQQKVQFIATILHSPDFLILDEPFSGFDPINVEALKKIILDLKEQGKTIVLSTHVMQQVEELCDDICLMNNGKIILGGNVREIKSQFGNNTLLMEFEGESSFLEGLGLDYINRSRNRIEVRLNDSTTSDEILKAAINKVKIFRFELMEPSFNEIFIDVVKNRNGEQNNG